ncbi:hypothetical protein HK096_007539 [Nowakowskiella sp. JEL0078]|nr:hypothetical protein HK096_007539 [Nowakowskiella sp. JEL0078]
MTETFDFKYFLVERLTGNILLIKINTLGTSNSLSNEAQWELHRILSKYENDDSLLCAILTGVGSKSFCAGQDLKSLDLSAGGKISSWDPYSEDPQISTQPPSGFGGLSQRSSLFKPLIAAVNGICLGGGMEMILAADIVIAADNAIFGLPESQSGVAPLAGGAVLLHRTVGYQRAMELMITGRRLSAIEALNWGVVNEVVSSENLIPRSLEVAKNILRSSPDSVRAIKRAVHLSLEEGNWVISSILGRNSKECDAMINGENVKEGISAFHEKRYPIWKPLSKL